jgi:hypothetical protein
MLNDTASLNERVCAKTAAKQPVLNQFAYLFECFGRVQHYRDRQQIADDLHVHCQSLIINMCRSIINIYEEQADELNLKFLSLVQASFSSSDDNGPAATRTFQAFYDMFVAQFEKNNDAFTRLFLTSEANTCPIEHIVEDKLELNFLNSIFVNLNKNVIGLPACEDYGREVCHHLALVKFLTRSKLMKYLLILNSFVVQSSSTLAPPRRWQTSTLLGKLLTPSVLPLSPLKAPPASANLLFMGGGGGGEASIQYKFFLNPGRLTKQDVEINEKNMHQAQLLIKKELHSFFYEHLIKMNSNLKIRHLFFNWVGTCLDENKAKMQEWSNLMQPNSFGQHGDRYVSDGFLLNLLDLFLTYSLPICSPHWASSHKLLKINVNYSHLDGRNFLGIEKETRLIPTSSSSSDVVSKSKETTVNFISECYYGTNSLVRLAYLSLNQKIVKLNSELARWQSTYHDLMSSGGGSNLDPQMSRVKTMFENMSVEFMNLKTALLEEDLVRKMSVFLFNSSAWLCYMAVGAEPDDFQNEKAVITKLNNLDVLREDTRAFNLGLLAQLPEYFITNIVEFMTFLSRFKEAYLSEVFFDTAGKVHESGGKMPDYLNSFVSLILTFMGRPDRLFNPHIRASLAEAVESLLPKKQQQHHQNQYDSFGRKNISYLAFAKHPCSSYLSEALIGVFVSIEMTGQSVQFEQKFNYRRPMYELIEYLWNMPTIVENSLSGGGGGVDSLSADEYAVLHQHRRKLKEMADFAYENLDNSEQPPLFLKFLVRIVINI